ncbi:hypothetical protein NDU88_002253 [Pleurodeles waltl]|uniref:Uncharacterized protein n=1 Tax=Pleurodeles waltl TaxID=8319 RepID=A0AAV7M009_PLEWA|nr:hypothetical protein NDU88_002253 [Pleurodeles waltl]
MKTGRVRKRGHVKIPVTGEIVLSRRFVWSKDKRRTTGPQGDERYLCKQKGKEEKRKTAAILEWQNKSSSLEKAPAYIARGGEKSVG